MYRLIYILAIMTFVTSCQWENNKRVCPWMRKHTRRFFYGDQKPESEIEKIRKQFIETEISLQALCNKNSNHFSKEMYDEDSYALEYVLEDIENLNIAVQIFYRLLQITVIKNDTNALVFEDLKVLSEVVKPGQAMWKLEEKTRILGIRIPYTIKFYEEPKKVCEPINIETINVPMAVDADLDSRYGSTPTDDNEDDVEDNFIFRGVEKR